MSSPTEAHFQILEALFSQRQNYLCELQATSRSIRKLCTKGTATQRALDEREERKLTRKSKKRLQWSRANTITSITELEKTSNKTTAKLLECEQLISIHGGCTSLETLAVPMSPLDGNVSPWGIHQFWQSPVSRLSNPVDGNISPWGINHSWESPFSEPKSPLGRNISPWSVDQFWEIPVSGSSSPLFHMYNGLDRYYETEAQ